MTVSSDIPSITYQGDGVTTLFNFGFRIIQESDLKVFIDTVQQVQFSDYDISNLTEEGGDVVFIVAPPALTDVLLTRATAKTQQVDLEPFSEFPANTLEFGLDKLTLITQEIEQRFVDDINPKVFSVFGRVGNVVADITDYSAFYADLTDYNAHKANVDAHHSQKHLLFGSDHTDVDLTTAPIVGSGLVWIGSFWEALDVWVAAGYGSVVQNTPVGIPDLGAGFTVLPTNAGGITKPRAITQDFANDGLRFNIEGVWNVNIVFSMVHAESNSGRQIIIQLYDSTADVVISAVVLPIARNQPGTYFSASILAEVITAAVGDLFQIRVGGGDVVAGVTLQTYEFAASHVSEFTA